MAWFKTVNDVDSSTFQNFPVVADLEAIYCQLLYSREQSFVPLVDAAIDDFVCSYKTHCFSLCTCCAFDACDCEMTCPQNCTCYHDTTWTKNIAECSSAGFHDLPDQLPMDATEIFLDGNIIGELHSHTFIGRKNLKVLYLNNSQLMSVENHTFNGLSVLEELHLEHNSISELQGDEFHGLVMLRELHLNDNRIKNVNNNTFQDLKRLQVLILSGNRIADFPVWQLHQNPSLQTVRLSENPWFCQCRFVAMYADWLFKERSLVPDAATITCTTGTNNEVTRILDRDVRSCQAEVVASSSAVEQQKENKDQVFLSDAARTSGEVQNGLVIQTDSDEPTKEISSGSSTFRDFLPIFLGIISAVILVVVAQVPVVRLAVLVLVHQHGKAIMNALLQVVEHRQKQEVQQDILDDRHYKPPIAVFMVTTSCVTILILLSSKQA